MAGARDLAWVTIDDFKRDPDCGSRCINKRLGSRRTVYRYRDAQRPDPGAMIARHGAER